ncbi:MAG: glycosyltransferase family 2 protein, partial [Clostridiaceae bacterium]|nr:glycosyltransferase family 2 protein [Clostridiaceae bacterium]
MKIMTVIPAYNEEKSIARVITLIKSIDIDQQIDIVVVDDGSVDNTATEAEKTGATVIRLPVNLGIGGAVQTGYLYALHNNYDCVVQIDGDGQHDPKDLPKLLGLIEDGQADLAVGSRFVEKTGYRPPFFRKMGICYFSGLVELVTGLKINDTTSGYRAV